MLDYRVNVRIDKNRMRGKAHQANIRGVRHGIAYVRKIAVQSIKKMGAARKEPQKLTPKGRISKAWLRWSEEKKKQPRAPVGHAPYTHTGRLPASILYAVDAQREYAVAGPALSRIGLAGAEHEHGRQFRREPHARRPFMFPALEKARPRLPSHWAGSIR